MLRSFWAKRFNFNWKLGAVLTLLICVPRFILVLDANARADYSLMGAIMVLSALAPFILLNKTGQHSIGLVKARSFKWLGLAFVFGLVASLILHLLGDMLYGDTYENWYVYIARSYKIPEGMSGQDKSLMFTIMALVGMTFSPIGEELFFRGIVQSSFSKSIGEKWALILEGIAFALVHIAHFGLVYINQKFAFFPIPTLIWVISIFLFSLLLYTLKRKSGSLLGAIACHSGFNLGMIYSIFYLM
jgi:membrane protease YdiL (CAAX protease family)